MKHRSIVPALLVVLASVLVILSVFGGAGRAPAKKWSAPPPHAQSQPSTASATAGWAY